MKSILTKMLCTFLIIFSFINTAQFNHINFAFGKDNSNAFDVELDISSITCEPPNLRRSNLKFDPELDPSINLNGLIDLNISGSGQFSKQGLTTIKNYINTDYTLYDVDLRQEPHGFVNEYPINWPRENMQKDASIEDVTSTQTKKLLSIPLNTSLSFSNVSCKTIQVKSVDSEEKLVKNHSINYMRFPVIDGELPTDKTVSDFIEFSKNLPMNSWIHFHCKEGIGRTTTFMIMYDIMKNKNRASLDEIIERQIILCNMKTDEKNGFLTEARLNFLKDFYNRDFN